MTAPYPQGEQTEAAIAAGMAAEDTAAVMRAIAASTEGQAIWIKGRSIEP